MESLVPLLIQPQLFPIPDPEINELLEYQLLGSRYYLLIHPPAASPNKAVIRYKVPHMGLTQHIIRLFLPASTHSGYNGAYKVQYWEHRPIHYPHKVKHKLKTADTLIREEWWQVPPCPKGECHLTLLRSDFLGVNEWSDIIDPPTCLDILKVNRIVTVCDQIEWEHFILEEFLYPHDPIRGRAVRHIAISWSAIRPRTAQEYTLYYNPPYGLCEVLYRTHCQNCCH